MFAPERLQLESRVGGLKRRRGPSAPRVWACGQWTAITMTMPMMEITVMNHGYMESVTE